MTVEEASKEIMATLRDIYEPGEVTAIRDWVLESLTGKTKSEQSSFRDKSINPEQSERLKKILQRLLQHEPLQYVLNESWFCGLKFYVDKNVLIPRPETEELVEWIISNCKFPVDTLHIFDIGTGSGCIPISLKRRLRKADVWACDISEDALKVARKNAEMIGTPVTFMKMNFLDEGEWEQLPGFDIIISNPPYIPVSERQTMAPNVLQFEPAIALFVPDENPMLFYDAIARFARKKLNANGSVYVEMHHATFEGVARLFEEKNFRVEIKRDMEGKSRMLKGWLE